MVTARICACKGALTQNQNAKDDEERGQDLDRRREDRGDGLAILNDRNIPVVDGRAREVVDLDVSPLEIAGVARREDNGH